MANVKSRQKPENKRKKGRSATKNTPSDVNNALECVTVMKRPSNIPMLTPEEKVQYLFRNGHLVRDKFISKPPLNNGKIDKNFLPITKDSLVSKSGRIKKKRMDNIRLFDNILKTELMINDSKKKKKSTNKEKSAANNNDDDITDHNINLDLSIFETLKNPGLYDDEDVEKKNKPKKRTPKTSPKTQQPSTGFNIDLDLSIFETLRNPGLYDDEDDEKKNKPKKRSPKTSPKKLPFVTPKEPSYIEVTVPGQSFQCDYCDKAFESKPSLSRHIYGHLNLKPHKCLHCSKKFRYESKMLEHINQDHTEVDKNVGYYVCDICGQFFFLKKNFNLHLATHLHNDEEYKCLFCDDTFSQYSALLRHEKQHLVTGRYICTICKMSYTCRDHLSLHLKGHLKIKEFVCQYCGKEFLRLNSMQRHVQVCHAGHRIKCPICKKLLKGHLTEHMRTHDKKRPHKCPDCGQRFTQSTQLNVHRRSHTGARPYPCRICEHRFSHSNALMLHIRRHTGEKPFSCAMCPLHFSQLPHMKTHMRNIHGKENAYKCNKCEQFFKLKVDLENHVKHCTVGDRELSFEEKIQASVQYEEVEVESVMSLSRMRYLLALLLSMIASKEKLKYLGFNKRLIDELLLESLEAMGITPCKDESLTPIKRLKANIEMLLNGTVPKEQMEKLKSENKSTEEILELLTDEKKQE